MYRFLFSENNHSTHLLQASITHF